MESPREGWIELLVRVGRSGLDVLAAEIAGLRRELVDSARRLIVAGSFAGLAFAAIFWGLGLALLAGVAGLAVWLPWWTALLVVSTLSWLGGLVLLWLMRSRIRSLDSPAAAVRRRLDDHLAWWQTAVADEAVIEEPIVMSRRRPVVAEED